MGVRRRGSAAAVGDGTPSTRQAVLQLIGPRRLRLGFLALASLASGLSEAGFLVVVTRTVLAVSQDVDHLELFGRELALPTVVVLSLGLVAVNVVAGVLTARDTAKLGAEVVADTRRALASAFLRASWEVQQREQGGRIQELLTTFTAQGATLINSVLAATTSGVSLIALLAVAIALGPGQALALMVVLGALSMVLRPVRAAIRRRAKHSAQVGMQFATALSEVSELGMEVHVFHVQEPTEKRVFGLIEQTSNADEAKTFARGLLAPVYTGGAFLAVVGALGLIVAAKSSGLESFGAIMLVMLRSLSYGQNVQSSSAQIAATVPYLHELQTQVATYEGARRRDEGGPVGRVGDLTLDSLTFSYEPGQPVLKDISLTIREGEIVGIVGPSGGGKSTLVQLLLGLRDPDVGHVLADGRPIGSLSRTEWARKVTFVPQGSHLIAGTIEENIRFLRDDVSHDDIVRAATLAHLDADIARFPEGYEREVGNRGGQLSGGQQQRLCIARALVERPDVLILDEPTSSLDMQSEQIVRQTLLELSRTTTIVIIAHRLSTLDICSRIMVIQEGELKGFDTPAALAETNAFYHDALVLSGVQ